MLIFMILLALTVSQDALLMFGNRHLDTKEKLHHGKTGFISFVVFTLLSGWLASAYYTWPSTDVIREVVVSDGKAQIYIELDDNSKSINLNRVCNRQFKDGDKIPIRIYNTWHMGLMATLPYKVENIYTGETYD